MTRSEFETVILKVTSLLFPRVLVITRTVFKIIFDLIAMIGTHQFAYTNNMLMELDESTHLTTDKRTVAGEMCAGHYFIVTQPNTLLHKTHPIQMLTHSRWNDSVAGF